MHRLCTTTFVLYCGLLLSLSPANATELDAPELSLGASLASSAQYGEAVPHLREAVRRDPNDGTAHYYLGVSLAALNRYMEARSELALAIERDGAHSIVGRLAQARLATFSTLPAVSPAKPRSAVVNSAIDTIRAQADERKGLQQSTFNQYANDVMETAAGRMAKLRTEQTQRISSMQNSYITDKWGNSYPLYTQAEIDAERQRYDEKINVLNQQSNEEATYVRGQAQGAKTGLDKMADNLQQELVDGSPIDGALKLNPVGTNLYVRNYVSAPGAKSAEPAGNAGPMAATPDKLILEPTNHPGEYKSHVVPAGLIADQDQMLLQRKQKPGSTENLSVTGRMLPPTTPAANSPRTAN